jgi:hypothetical protein
LSFGFYPPFFALDSRRNLFTIIKKA